MILAPSRERWQAHRATITVDLIRVEAKLCDDRQYLPANASLISHKSTCAVDSACNPSRR